MTSSLQPLAANASLCVSTRRCIDILNEENCTDVRRACPLSMGIDNIEKLNCASDIDNGQINTNNVSICSMSRHSRSVNAAECDKANMENSCKDRSASMITKRENMFVVSDDDLDDILSNL
jgi:hypothetical protein